MQDEVSSLDLEYKKMLTDFLCSEDSSCLLLQKTPTLTLWISVKLQCLVLFFYQHSQSATEAVLSRKRIEKKGAEPQRRTFTLTERGLWHLECWFLVFYLSWWFAIGHPTNCVLVFLWFYVYLVSSSPSSHWGLVCCLCCVAWCKSERKTKVLSFINLLDVGEVYSRLLDHRPVIQGEIRYFVKEFEVSIYFWLDTGTVWNVEQL